jgi:RimJ/RimL family protein N-acetyltransferase
VSLIYFLATPEKPSSVHLAEGSGYRLMDTQMTFVHGPGDDGCDVTSPPGVVVRDGRLEDLEVLRPLSRRSHRITRFYADPHLPEKRCDDLYERWVEAAFEGRDDVVLVAEEQGAVLGYHSFRIEHDGGRAIGIPSLMSIVEEARGRGIARALVSRAQQWFSEQGALESRAVIQGHNIASMRLFQGCGYFSDSVRLWFHKWYADPKV